MVCILTWQRQTRTENHSQCTITSFVLDIDEELVTKKVHKLYIHCSIACLNIISRHQESLMTPLNNTADVNERSVNQSSFSKTEVNRMTLNCGP